MNKNNHTILSKIKTLEEEILHRLEFCHPNKRVDSLAIQIKNTILKIQGHLIMTYQLKDSEQTVIHARALDSQGAVVASAALIWATSDANIVTVTPAADGMSAVVSTTGTPGGATVTVTAGSVSVNFDINVVSGEVVSIELTAEAPTSRIAPPPAPVVDAPAPEVAPAV